MVIAGAVCQYQDEFMSKIIAARPTHLTKAEDDVLELTDRFFQVNCPFDFEEMAKTTTIHLASNRRLIWD